ncbi:ribonuclease H-like domain-containing protein [Tanacetum coccineum]|uniref:Ribonuclease H-like domain-containing protein n=1 Tax=Tanacetum coccineum TaxID=301880 RepID=A0ABQ5GF09_9ASTR
MDKCKTRLGYNTVPPPYKSDLVHPCLDDFIDVNESVSESVVEKPTVKTNEPKTSRKENGAPIIEDWVSDSDEENVAKVKTVEMFNKPSFVKINFVKSTKQVKSLRKTSVNKNRQNTPSPRGNKRNWNQQMSPKLGSNFEMFNKACHVCGSFDHLKNDFNNWSGPILLNTARPVNTIQPRTAVNNAGPMKNVINNAYSTARRPFNKITTANNNNFTKKVNTVKGTKVNTARPKAVLSALNGNKGNAVKALACWVWRPKNKGNPQQDLKNKGVINSGCSRHMTGNKSYLSDYEEINGGFVAIGGNSKGGKITGKGRKACDDACKARMETLSGKNYILLPMWPDNPLFSQNSKSSPDAGFKPSREDELKVTEEPRKEGGNSSNDQEKDDNINITNNINIANDRNSTNNVNVVSLTINAAGTEVNAVDPKTSIELPNDPNMPELEDIMDVKSAFLYGKIEEEVYLCQPPGFEDPDFSDRVYKVEKALYGVHQAPRACINGTTSSISEIGPLRPSLVKTVFSGTRVPFVWTRAVSSVPAGLDSWGCLAYSLCKVFVPSFFTGSVS